MQTLEATGLPCLIVHQSSLGHLCGYVGVPRGHRLYGLGYDDAKTAEGEYPDVHGGLTYADKCIGNVCHKVEAGEDDDVWWLGFDCAHSGDLSPYSLTRRSVAKLAEQIA